MTKPARWESESAMARAAVEWLRGEGWTVREEVLIEALGWRADIVATRDGVAWIVETKLGMGLDVIAQALVRLDYAERVSVAVPGPPPWNQDRGFALGLRVCRDHGIGVVCLRRIDAAAAGKSVLIREELPAKHRNVPVLRHRLTAALRDDQFAPMAGTRGGGYATPFSRTAAALAELVRAEPGIALSEAVKRIQHHYASDRGAASSLRIELQGHRREAGVPWALRPIRFEFAGTRMRLFPAESAEAPSQGTVP